MFQIPYNVMFIITTHNRFVNERFFSGLFRWSNKDGETPVRAAFPAFKAPVGLAPPA
jgi:hypothetical protein